MKTNDYWLDQPWPWNIHLEFRNKHIPKDAAQIIEDILEGTHYKMTDKLVLDSERAIALTVGELDDEYEYVDSEFAGEWRWGVSYQVVIKDKKQGKLWGVTYREQVGDNFYSSLEDGGTVHFYPVEAVEVTSYEYKRIKE